MLDIRVARFARSRHLGRAAESRDVRTRTPVKCGNPQTGGGGKRDFEPHSGLPIRAVALALPIHAVGQVDHTISGDVLDTLGMDRGY